MTPATNQPDVYARLLEKISERLQTGQEVDIERYRTEYPEHADQLEKILPSMRALAQLGNRSDEEDAADEFLSPKSLGDFRIVRQIARGGMGIVYEAEQMSLGRRVAVKVLPFAAMLSTNQLQRFKNEAQAAATLQHAHIVNAFFFGQERGVYFYAMQLIEGQSLAEIIASDESVTANKSSEPQRESSNAGTETKENENEASDRTPRTQGRSRSFLPHEPRIVASSIAALHGLASKRPTLSPTRIRLALFIAISSRRTF